MKKYQRKDLVFDKIGEEVLVIDHERGNLIRLNHSASFLWELLKTPKTINELSLGFINKFGKGKAADVKTGLKDLLNAKVVR